MALPQSWRRGIDDRSAPNQRLIGGSGQSPTSNGHAQGGESSCGDVEPANTREVSIRLELRDVSKQSGRQRETTCREDQCYIYGLVTRPAHRTTKADLDGLMANMGSRVAPGKVKPARGYP